MGRAELEDVMGSQNRYCTKCGKTTRFCVEGAVFTCQGCGVRVDTARRSEAERVLVGDPFSFRIKFV